MTEKEIIVAFSDNFKRLRKLNKMSQKDVADKLGRSTSIVSEWENGAKMPRGPQLMAIADLFNVPYETLIGRKENQLSTIGSMTLVPVVGRISCGNGALAYEDIEGYESTPTDWLSGGEHFYLRAKGDSMVGARIYDGDLLLIRKQPEVENGEIAAVLLDDSEDAVLKRVYFNNGQVVLQSENPSYAPIFCPPSKAKIIGKLKKIVINL